MKTFTLQIITAKEVAFEGQIESLVLPGARGFVGVLADHAPFVTTVNPGLLTLKTDGQEKRFQIGKGFFEVLQNKARVLTESASLS